MFKLVAMPEELKGESVENLLTKKSSTLPEDFEIHADYLRTIESPTVARKELEGIADIQALVLLKPNGEYMSVLYTQDGTSKVNILAYDVELNLNPACFPEEHEDPWKLKSVGVEPEFNPKDRNMVFCAIYCDKESTVYADYKTFTESSSLEKQRLATVNVPTVLMVHRWDGKIGFPGGHVEKHHTSLLDALKDELREEISYEISEEELAQKVVPFRTYAHKDKNIVIHSFKMKVDLKTLKALIANAPNAEHFVTETTAIAVQILESNMKEVLSHPFSGTAGKELSALIIAEHLLEKSGQDTSLTRERFSGTADNSDEEAEAESVKGF